MLEISNVNIAAARAQRSILVRKGAKVPPMIDRIASLPLQGRRVVAGSSEGTGAERVERSDTPLSDGTGAPSEK